VALAADGREAASKTARRRAIKRAIAGVAQVLGNTPAVARKSYTDPRVFDRYLSGWTIGAALDRIGTLDGPDDRSRRRLELAVLELLDDYRRSPSVERIDAVAARPQERMPERPISAPGPLAVLSIELVCDPGGFLWRHLRQP
jgi:hypothetical protein